MRFKVLTTTNSKMTVFKVSVRNRAFGATPHKTVIFEAHPPHPTPPLSHPYLTRSRIAARIVRDSLVSPWTESENELDFGKLLWVEYYAAVLC